MSFRVSGKNLELGEALRERISGSRSRSASRNISRVADFPATSRSARRRFGFQTECVLHLDSGIVLRADAMAADAYLSANQAADNLEKQLRRYHRKLSDHHADDDVPVADGAERPPR